MASAELAFVQDLAILLTVAAITAVAFSRLHQPVVLGYIMAGMLIGPHTPPFALVHDLDTIRLLAELGVVFLFFSLGLEFDLGKLRRVGLTAAVAGTLQILLMIWIGFLVGQAFGLSGTDSIFLGALMSISSTVIIVKIVDEFGQQEEKWAQLAFGILIIEDILAVCILTLLSTPGGPAGTSLVGVGLTLVNIGFFIAAALGIGMLGAPRLLAFVSKGRADEILLLTVVGLATGLAAFGALLGFSPALGAFLMGAIIAETRQKHEVVRLVRSVRDIFAAIFFVSVGMLIDPAVLMANWVLVAAVASAVIGGKVATVSFGVFITGHEPRTALRTGISLAQIGEFSFIIAGLGVALGLTHAPLYEVAVSVAAITAFTTPFLIRRGPRMADAMSKRAPRPLVNFVRMYDTWIRRLATLRPADPARVLATRHFLRLALFGAVLTEVLLLGGAALAQLSALLATSIPAVEPIAEAVAWTLVGMTAMPFAFLFFKSLRGLGEALAEAATPEAYRATRHGKSVKVVLRNAFTLTGVVALAIVLLSATASVLPALPVIVAVGAALVVGGGLFYRSLRSFEDNVEAAIGGALAGRARGAGQEGTPELITRLHEQYPWGIEERRVAIGRADWSAGHTIAQTHLRAETAATIIDVQREGINQVNPAPEFQLAEGDTVVLVGEPPHLDAAVRILKHGPARPEVTPAQPVLREVRIAEGSLAAGSTLAALHAHERTGATVVAVLRGERHLQDPSPDFGLETGDTLLVLGVPEAVERLAALVGSVSKPHENGSKGAAPPTPGPAG